MPSNHSVVTIPANSGLNRDKVVMTFNFNTQNGNEAAAIINFLNQQTSGNTDTMASWMSPWLSRATLACMVQQFAVDPAEYPNTGFGAPYFTQMFTLGPTLQTPAPQELAVACSYHADMSGVPEHGPGGSRPKSTFRGRFYFGPLTTAALDYDNTTHRCLVKLLLRQALQRSLGALLVAEPGWCVWSRTGRVMRPIIGGWVDDDFDIQRRRGVDAAARTPWP